MILSPRSPAAFVHPWGFAITGSSETVYGRRLVQALVDYYPELPMLKLSRLGSAIAPAMPAFYYRPESIEELVDLPVPRVGGQMGLELPLAERRGASAREVKRYAA